MRKSIIILSHEYPPNVGGIGEWVYQVGLALRRAGWDVTVVTTEGQNSDFTSQQATKTYRIIPGQDNRGWTRYMAALKHYRFALEILQIVKEQRPGYILAADMDIYRGYNGLLRWMLLRGSHVPKGVVFHGMDVEGFPQLSRMRRYLLNGILSRMNNIFCNSHFTMQTAKRTFTNCVGPVFVGCGLSPETLPLPIEKESARQYLNIAAKQVILSVARLVPRKGMDMVIKAMPQILARFPDTQYVIAGGEGADLPRLQHLVKEAGCTEHVRFAGFFDRMAAHYYYCSADVFVMPARHMPFDVEGFGIVYLEAAHYGLPVIGGRSGGVADAIVEGETGLLVNPEDPHEIGSAIIRLLEDPELSKQYGIAGQRRVRQELTWDAVAGRIIDEIGCGEAMVR